MDQTTHTEHKTHNTVRRNQIIIAIAAFILGVAVASAAGMHERRDFPMRGGYEGNGRIMQQRRMMNPNMQQAQPENGAMMQGQAGTEVQLPPAPTN